MMQGAMMGDVMRFVLLGRTILQWVLAAAFIAGGFAAGHICSRVVSLVLKRLCAKTQSRLDDLIIAGIRSPLVFILTLGGIRLGVESLGPNPVFSLWADRVFQISLILFFALALNKITGALILRYVPDKTVHPLLKGEAALQPVLRKFLASLAWIIAAALILRVLGYNISALLAGLGLGGAALALASKDTLSNFFGSITVFMDKPFQINDRIRIGNYEGVITEIGIRTSRLRTPENRMVVIPNSLFTASPIENISSAPSVRIAQTIKVQGSNGIEQLEQALALLRDIRVSGLEGRCDAGLASIGGAACDISLVFCIDREADYRETLNAVNLEILRRFQEAGIRLL
jgi:MscS family membrane protein